MAADPVTITLSRPVTSVDREFSVLTIREPTGADLVQSGYPLKFGMGEDRSGRMDVEAMSKLIRLCSGIARRAVEQLAMRDWNACAMAIMGFLGEAEEISTISSMTTTNGLDGGETSVTS